jgi:hypothetical protein
MLITLAGSHSHLRGQGWAEISRLVFAQLSSDILEFVLKVCDLMGHDHDCLCMAMAYRNERALIVSVLPEFR